MDQLIESREQYGALLYSRYIDRDEPTPHFFRVVRVLLPVSMVSNNPVSFVASMARVATVEMLASGEFNAAKKD